MTLALVNQPVDVPGGLRLVRTDVTFDSSYLTGGELLVPKDLGLSQVIAAIPVGFTNSGRQVVFTGTTLKVLNPGAQIKQTAIAGAAAGNHTVTGILTTDTLVSVIHLDSTTKLLADKTSEYTITAGDTINNTAGTSSASNTVLVTYSRGIDNEVASTTDLSAETVSLLVFGIK